MKTIGLIGGMSYESTLTYYGRINSEVARRLGGFHSAQLVMASVDFAPIEAWQRSGEWDKTAGVLVGAARTLQTAGADFVLLCTNTMHKVADAIEAALTVPFLHIAEVTADALLAAGVGKVALLGTRYTMEQDFYTGRLEARGLEVLLPGAAEREEVNRVIFDELCQGQISEDSRAFFVGRLAALAGQGAEAAILGCTEIGLLVGPDDTPLPLFDTALLHADAAVTLALEGDS